MNRRKICVVTGTRAEYGLLSGLMKQIQEDPELELLIAVTGMHMSPEFGLTYQAIENDGFIIHEKLEMLLSSDSAVGVTKSIGLGVMGFGEIFARIKPDLVVVLGDRFEVLAAAQAAMVSRIPIAHLYGGETTEGAIDEAIRHAVTKMSHLHFVSADPYLKKVIQLGESPDRVFNVGALAVDNFKAIKLLDRDEFQKSIGFELAQMNFLVTYHPVTLNDTGPKVAMQQLLQALDHFPEAHIIFTKPNSDTDGRMISVMIDEYCDKNPERAKLFVSLGQLRYLTAISHVQAVIGNSSSGLIEVPYFHKPTVNIGDRQKGRLKPKSVIDCADTEQEIVHAIRTALSVEFQQSLPSVPMLFGEGPVAIQIKNVLKTTPLDGLIKKKFFEIGM